MADGDASERGAGLEGGMDARGASPREIDHRQAVAARGEQLRGGVGQDHVPAGVRRAVHSRQGEVEAAIGCHGK